MKFVKYLVLAVIIVGLGVLGAKKIKEVKEHDASLAKAQIYPIVVKTFTPKVTNVKITLPYLSEVNNDEDVELASRIVSRIMMIKPSGSKVKKGEVVAKLDITQIESGLKSTQQQLKALTITLDNLHSTHQRTLDLLKVQGASIEEAQKEITQIANTQAQINGLKEKEVQLKNDLSYATIVSPVDGVVSKTFANAGSLSSPGKPLVSISSKNGFYLMVRVPTDLSVIGVELNSRFYTATPLDTTFHVLAEYKVYIIDTKLISGDRIEVDVVTMKQKGILLPFDTILNRDGKNYVLIVNQTQATPQEITILQSGEQGVVVSNNFEGKKLVLAKPDILLKLVSGFSLKIKE